MTESDRIAAEKAKKKHVQDQLDEALAESSPASDPVSIVTSQHEEWEDEEDSAPKGK